MPVNLHEHDAQDWKALYNHALKQRDELRSQLAQLSTTREIARELAAAVAMNGYHSIECSKIALSTAMEITCSCGLSDLLARAAGLLDAQRPAEEFV